MIQVEGYRAFRGIMKIIPTNPSIDSFTVTGDFLYKPDTHCWYCKGKSYPENICRVVLDKTN